MKVFIIIAVVFGFNCMSSCNSSINNVMSIQVRDTFLLPGIPSAKTIHFNGNNVYYQSMDEPDKETFKCFSLEHNKLVWSKDINQIGINEGAITITGEYVVPTLSDSVYLINEEGNERRLKLEYRSKTNPLIYKNTFILQDRGVGIKCFDAETLQQLWLIKQQGSSTMSQPLLLDSSIIYVLDDNSIQSSNAASGKLIWRTQVKDSLSIQLLYGMYKNIVFVLSTDLERIKFITAYDGYNGIQIWKVKVDSTMEVWETSMAVTAYKLFCRGDSSVFIYSLQDGNKLGRYDYKSRIATNLVADKNGNVLFGLENNTLMKIDNKGNELSAVIFKSKLNRLYRFNNGIFLYSYPNLYSLEIEP